MLDRMPHTGSRWESAPAGAAVAVAAVGAITALIYPLKEITAPESAGVAYLLAVLLVATLWGFRLGLLTSVLSAAAFNFFHLPPLGRFTIADSGHAVALVAFLVAAVGASAVASLARSRAREADERRREAALGADLARILLGGTSVRDALPEASERLRARIELAPDGSFTLDRDVGSRVHASLKALLGAAVERDRLQAEVVETSALRRSDELKTALLRSVSHDLRTPLTAIMTAGAALAGGGLSEADRIELGRAVVEESERLTALVEKLIDLSRLQAGAWEPRRDWCSVDELLHEAAGGLDPGGTRFSFSLDPDLPLVRADAAQLERAFANLLENALRYSPRVYVRARVVGGQLIVRVVDRGPGIAPGDLTRIFDPFVRAGAGAGASGHPGSGLGLAIVKGFVESNGGRVWAESLPGQGTSFVVALPLEPAAETVP
jgi:two-component system, OmpR family, sensor histidine kinase KdpD